VRERSRVASFQTVLASILRSALDNLSKKDRTLNEGMTQLDIENALPALANGKVDLIMGETYPRLLPLTNNTVEREHLIDDELVLITPEDSQLTFEDFIKDAEVSAETAFAVDSVDYSLGRFFHAYCRQHGVQPNVIFETPDPFLQTHLVRAGHAC